MSSPAKRPYIRKKIGIRPLSQLRSGITQDQGRQCWKNREENKGLKEAENRQEGLVSRGKKVRSYFTSSSGGEGCSGPDDKEKGGGSWLYPCHICRGSIGIRLLCCQQGAAS